MISVKKASSPEATVADRPTSGRTSVPEFVFRDVGQRFAAPNGAEFVAVEGIDLDIEPGTFVSIIGPSGCGKSTLLNMVAGLRPPTTGTVSYRGTPVRGINTDVGYLTQHDSLLPWRTVERNVAIGLEVRGTSRRDRRERVREVLEVVGLSKFGAYYPSQLSGGMRKRAMLARTLVYGPSTLLMDEPFGALDALLQASLQEELLRIWESDRKTVLFVTHNLDEALLLSDRVVVFGANPGRVVHVEDVGFDRPRDAARLRREPQFIAAHDRLHSLIREHMGSR